MTGILHRLSLLVLIALALALAACGTVATPEWAANVQETKVAQAATSEHLTAIAPTATPTITPSPTPIPPTATPTATSIPPTATSIPPTATSIPTMTPVPHADAHAHEATAESSSAAETSDDAIAAALAAGDPANGQVVFNTPHIMPDGASWMCASCHSVDSSGMRLIGPGLFNVRVHGALHVPGQNVVEYIHNSIINPSDFIVPVNAGEPPWPLQMPHGFGDVLTEQEINDVIAYLLTLHD